jgi:hypothetical protein
MLRSPRDIQQAIAEGRSHNQRFFKAAAGGADGQWWDWSFASGQPAYDARVGNALEFTPCIAQANDAIWFPAIEAGMERQLAGITVKPQASGQSQVAVSFEVYDLIGVYPLIDGDSTDIQEMDNSAPLPRYSTGDGIIPVLVNHVAPQIQAADGTMVYTTCAGVQRTVTIRAALTGLNRVVSAHPSAGAAGQLSLPRADGCGGVRSIDSLTWTAAPGGLYSLYLIRPLFSFTHWSDPISAASSTGNKMAIEKCNCTHNAWHLPRIYDGAHIGMFFMTSAGGRTMSLFGHMNFIWG